MRILHVTPHLPAQNTPVELALPRHLGEWTTEKGGSVEYVAHPPRSGRVAPLPGPVEWVRPGGHGAFNWWISPGALWRIHRALAPGIGRADVVHAHGSGLLAEIAVLLARRRHKPVLLTLYGPDIWHYRPRRPGPDLFTRAYHAASWVTFPSERLLAHAREIRLTRRGMTAISPPVRAEFEWHDERQQADVRAALRISNRHLLVNVNPLHRLAGQRHLLDAMNEVIRTHPDTRVVFCGTGPLLEELKGVARSAGVERHARFVEGADVTTVARFCAAADLFVLPSLLEALPVVAVEALACGTPVVSTDNPGGLELSELFGPDVTIVTREQPLPLAAAIAHFLENKRRTSRSTYDTIEHEFRPAAVAAKYRGVYEQLAARHDPWSRNAGAGPWTIGAKNGRFIVSDTAMKLIERIGEDMTAAMRAQDRARLAPLRMAKAALINREVEKGRELDETEAQQVIASLIKQRRDSIEQFRQGGRDDLADREAAEIATLETYLPPPLDPAEVEGAVDAAIAETGAVSGKDLGRVMKAVMPRLSGRSVDGKAVNEIVRRKLGSP